MNKRHYEHTLPNIRGSLSNTYALSALLIICLNGYILLLFSGKLENFILSIGTFVKKTMRKIKKYLKGKRHPLIRKRSACKLL